MDIMYAFLHGELEWEICMIQLRGFKSKGYPKYVCKTGKTLYSLK